jgi:hypothetical protein
MGYPADGREIIRFPLHRPDSNKSQVIFQLLSQDTADAAAELYTDVFLNDEPMTCRHGIAPGRFLPYARFYLRFCSEQQLYSPEIISHRSLLTST